MEEDFFEVCFFKSMTDFVQCYRLKENKVDGGGASTCLLLSEPLKWGSIIGSASELLFDSKKLIVFGDPVCSGGGASLDLSGIGSHRQI